MANKILEKTFQRENKVLSSNIKNCDNPRNINN